MSYLQHDFKLGQKPAPLLEQPTCNKPDSAAGTHIREVYESTVAGSE